MNTKKNNIILVFLLITFFMVFKFSSLVQFSVMKSVELFFTNLVPSMFPMFLMIDLLLNYGLGRVLYRHLKSNSYILIVLSLLAGTPSNAKYIKEFYENDYISKDMANYLLTFSYSPNPLFILSFILYKRDAFLLLAYIYVTDLIIALIFRRKFKNLKSANEKEFVSVSFVECLSNSIYKSAKILILILGIVITFGIVNSFMDALNISSPLLASLIELTNAFALVTDTGANNLWLIFASAFGGLSIHAQIKSILEDTDLAYKYFLCGRLIASIPVLVMALFK